MRLLASSAGLTGSPTSPSTVTIVVSRCVTDAILIQVSYLLPLAAVAAHTSKTKHLEQILVPQPRRRVHEPRVEALSHLFTRAVEQEPARPHQVEHDARVRS